MAKKPDTKEASIPRMRMSEMGTVGLKTAAGLVIEECKKELRFPRSIKTYKEMSYDSTVSSAIGIYEMLMKRVEWDVEYPDGASDEQKKRAQFIRECMNDMEHSWKEFIGEITSYITYGFSVHEKVYRRRYKENGSKYSDGLVGWRKLPVRSQDTISKWVWSDDGRELVAVEQDPRAVEGGSVRYKALTGRIEIPRKKFLLFRCDPKRDNPEGSSLLNKCYFSWKFKVGIQEQEAIGIARDMAGLPVLYIPPRYMSKDASDDEKEIYNYYKEVINNLRFNEQAGLILPQAFDPDSREKLFEFELMGTQGGKSYDSSRIIQRYSNEVLTTFFADILTMGQDKVGSYSLASNKSSILSTAIEAKLAEIADVINQDLIPQTFALNGWSDTELPKVVFSDVDEQSLDEMSKFIQRVFSVGAMELDRDVANKIREVGKFPTKPEDEPIDWDTIPSMKMAKQSKAGAGMTTAGEGTAKSPSGRDNSTANNANANFDPFDIEMGNVPEYEFEDD